MNQHPGGMERQTRMPDASSASASVARLLPPSLRWERVHIRGPRGLSKVEDRLNGLAASSRADVRVRVRGDRVTAVAVRRERTDLWVPVLKGRLVAGDSAVELVGVLRPAWSAIFGIAYPFALVAVGLLPSTELRWAVLGVAALSALVFWGIGPWFDRLRNAERRRAILGQIKWALAASA